ncbi:hypothetical protein [Roseibium litorale]|uniref:Uncharacterized protein n=1 Tax=Roseibium litorale TaxID=2803841 RepID=A0ABR9CHH9_9HYPH|nr:hypothetical protein [Roseibium litorale]MBD8890203.1 hypothetical protein [Roseibium litorale]
MVKKFLISGLLSLALFPSTVLAAQSGDWHVDTVKGFEKYWTKADDGSLFTIWCHRTRKLSGTVIDVDIRGKAAPARKTMRVIIDRHMQKVTADTAGYVQTDCAACADGYTVLWQRLRTGHHLSVMFEDESMAKFSLTGARDVLAESACPADFYK